VSAPDRQPDQVALSSGPSTIARRGPAAILERLFVWGWCVADVDNGEGIDCMLRTQAEAEAYADSVYGPDDGDGLRKKDDGETEGVVIFSGLCLRDEDEGPVHTLSHDEVASLGICEALPKREATP
jgi:hypothetical protein